MRKLVMTSVMAGVVVILLTLYAPVLGDDTVTAWEACLRGVVFAAVLVAVETALHRRSRNHG